MAMLGFLVLVMICLYLLVQGGFMVFFGTLQSEMTRSSALSSPLTIIGIVLLVLAVGAGWLAFEYAPFTITNHP